MGKATKLNFSTIENPYNSNLNREESEIDSISDTTGIFSVASTTSDKSGNVSTDIINSPVVEGSSFENMWISSWIRSRSYKPKSAGFLIDGKLGYIECMKLYVGAGGIEGGSIHIPDKTTTNSFHVDTTGLLWSGANEADKATAPVRINPTGEMTLGDPTGIHLQLSGPNVRIRSSNYSSGYAGSGFHIDEDQAEFGNIACRGIFRSAVMQFDNTFAFAGNQIIAKGADILKTTMTVADNSTVEIENDSSASAWAVGDILRLKDANDTEWLEITAVNGNVYTCNRDKKGDYGAGANPVWKEGQAVENWGQSGDGLIYSTASEANAPYMDIITHGGEPWLTSGSGEERTTRLRIGNLNGYLGYSSDLYGIGIGDSDNYLKFDPTDKLQIRVSGANALHIEYGSDILLTHGGDIKFTSVTAPTACTSALIETAGNIDAGTHKYVITYINSTGETEIGSVSNTVTNDGTHKQNSLTSIPISSSSSVISRKIYRTKAGGFEYFLLATLNNNTSTTYTDNIADASLGSYTNNYRVNDSFGKVIVDDEVILNVMQTNTFVGVNAGDSMDTGYDNIFIGDEAGEDSIDGKGNVFIGSNAGRENANGDYNTFVGKAAGQQNSGDFNVSIGGYSGSHLAAGEFNTFIGYNAGAKTSGSRNVFLGFAAGKEENGSDKLYIDNTNTTTPLIYGDFANNNLGINLKSFGGGVGVISIANATTVPTSSPTGGGVIYCEGGALKYRGSSGTITTIANA